MSLSGVLGYQILRVVLAGPDRKGKGKAEEEGGGPGVDADAQQPAPDSEEAQAQKAARDRVRSWQRLRLEGLTLLADVLESAEDALGRRRTRKSDEAAAAEARLVSIREDLQQASNCPGCHITCLHNSCFRAYHLQYGSLGWNSNPNMMQPGFALQLRVTVVGGLLVNLLHCRRTWCGCSRSQA